MPDYKDLSKKFFLVILVVVLGMGLWFARQPFVAAVDAPVHLRCALLFNLNLVDNLQWPDWDAMAYGGRGSPILRYLGVLPLFFASLLQLVGFDVFWAVKLTVCLYAIVGILGLLKLYNQLNFKTGSWSAVLLLLQPVVAYHLGWAFLFQNLCAMLLSSWLWVSCLRILRDENGAIVSAGVVFAAIFFTHPPSAMMLGYMWAILLGIKFLQNRRQRLLVAVFLAPLLGGMLAAPYLLPLFMTRDYVYYREVNDLLKPGKEGAFFIDSACKDHDNTEFSLLQGFVRSFSYTSEGGPAKARPAFSDLMPFQRGDLIRPWLVLNMLLLLLASLPGVFKWRKGGENELDGLVWLVPALFCFFMTTSWSAFLYRLLPEVSNVQYPWRWVLPASIFMIPLIAAGLQPEVSVAESSVGSQRPYCNLTVKLMVLLLVAAAFWAQSLYYTMPAAVFVDFMNNPGSLEPFLPRVAPAESVLPHAAPAHQLKFLTGRGSLLSRSGGTTDADINLKVEQPAKVIINTHNDGLWLVNINDRPVTPENHDKTGLMQFFLPAGEQHISIRRMSPPGRYSGWAISLLVAGLLVLKRRRQGDG